MPHMAPPLSAEVPFVGFDLGDRKLLSHNQNRKDSHISLLIVDRLSNANSQPGAERGLEGPRPISVSKMKLLEIT